MSDEELAEQFANDGYAIGCTRSSFDSAKDGFLAGRKSNSKCIADLEEMNADLKQCLDWANEREGEYVERITQLKTENEELKKYAKLLQDICTVMGGDIYMVSVGLENRVKTLWDASEEKEGLEMVKSIENRLLKIKPQDWAEIEKW